MGSRGALPKELPANVRKLKQAAGSARAVSGSKARLGRPVPPEDFTATERARWDQVVADLEPIGLLAQSDTHLLTQFVRASVLADSGWADFVERGVVVPSSHHGMAKNPAIQVWRDAVSKMESLGKVLGLSPEARLRMPTVEDDLDDVSDLD